MITDNCLYNYEKWPEVAVYENCRNQKTYIIENTTKADFDLYEEQILKAGALKKQSSCICRNYAATFELHHMEIHIYYTENDNRTHIIADQETDFPEDDIVGSKEECGLYQFEVDYRKIDCGMCYILQTGGGRFFIIDSAHMNSVEDHLRIHELLKKLSPDKKIVIAGWFFTHGHQDHIAKFMDFVKENFADVEIQRVYSGFPALDVPGAEGWKADDKETMREFQELNDAYGWKHIRLHTGQRFQLDELKFTVLFTYDDICEEPLTCYNDSSTILLLEAKGTKVVFLGDSNVRSSVELTARYGHGMKTDIVQVAHHGLNDSNVGIYYMLQAKTALYPTAQQYFQKKMDSEANRAVLKTCREHYIAGEGTRRFCFPYHLGESELISREIQEM